MSRWPVCLLVLSLSLLAQEPTPVPKPVTMPDPTAIPVPVAEPPLPAAPATKPTTAQPLLDKVTAA